MKTLNIFQGRGPRCRYPKQPSEDVVVAYEIPGMDDTAAMAHLKELETKLDKTYKYDKPASTWASAIITPSGDLVWAARGDAQITLFTYDEATQEVTAEVINMLHTPLVEIADLEMKISRGDAVSEVDKQRLGMLKYVTNGMGRLGDTMLASRGFGSQFTEEDEGFRHASDFGSVKLDSKGKKLFLMVSSDGLFETPSVFMKRDYWLDYGDGFITEKHKIEAPSLGVDVQLTFDANKKATAIHIDGTQIDLVNNTFVHNNVHYIINTGVNSRTRPEETQTTWIHIVTAENALTKQYCDIIKANLAEPGEAHKAIAEAAKPLSTDDLSYTFMEVTNLPQNVAVASSIFDGSGGHAVSKQCGEITAQYATEKGAQNVVLMIAKTKDDPEICIVQTEAAPAKQKEADKPAAEQSKPGAAKPVDQSKSTSPLLPAVLLVGAVVVDFAAKYLLADKMSSTSLSNFGLAMKGVEVLLLAACAYSYFAKDTGKSQGQEIQ